MVLKKAYGCHSWRITFFFMFISLMFLCNYSSAQGYCEIGGGCDEYISHVSISGFGNNTGCEGYGNFTNFEFEVMPGETETLYIIIGNGYSSDSLGVWVDWNQNLDFYDPEDEIAIVGGVGPHTIDVTIPWEAEIGITRLRIRLCYNQTPDPCGITEFGEVEDYTFIVYERFTYCGDANGDSTQNVADAIYIINAIFKDGPKPDPLCNGDANGDAVMTIGDVVFLINYIFRGGKPPIPGCCAI